MSQPYNQSEELAAASLNRAMTLFSFTAACRLMNVDPVATIGDIAEILLCACQKDRPIAQQRQIGLAYQRVLGDLQQQIFRGKLAEQMQREEVSR